MWRHDKIVTIISADGKQKGETTGGTRRCQMSGCTGKCLRVRWPDGRITWPCTKGLVSVDDNTARIAR